MLSVAELNTVLGEPLNWNGASEPVRQILEGTYVRLEPLSAARHSESLYAASHGENANPHLWDYMPYEPFPTLDSYAQWLDAAAQGRDPLFFAVLPTGGPGQGAAQGTVALMRIAPEHGSVEIGHVWFGPHLQKTPAATEAIYLLLCHAFSQGFRRVEWKCHNLNAASKRAALRFGFQFEGVFRAHLVVKGRNRDTAWFSMLDSEWPQRRVAFEAWLSPSNFDVQGKQLQTLGALNTK